jgi:polyisoprenoid-binding protein YceI
MKPIPSWVSRITSRRLCIIIAFALLVASMGAKARAQEVTLQVDPAQSSVKFTLGDVLHTVRGTFTAKSGVLRFDAATGKISGSLVVDGKSGQSGSAIRDRKMNKEILESDRYPEIAFRPTLVEGAVEAGKFSAKVHGILSIHGVEREITVPAEVDIEPSHWTANIHFTVPYEKWGMKNPSTLFLHVDNSVEIDLAVAGSVVR